MSKSRSKGELSAPVRGSMSQQSEQSVGFQNRVRGAAEKLITWHYNLYYLLSA